MVWHTFTPAVRWLIYKAGIIPGALQLASRRSCASDLQASVSYTFAVWGSQCHYGSVMRQ